MGGVNVAFVIWRELFEAILIVSIVHAFLARQVDPARARRLAGAGIGLGVGLSLLLGVGFQVLQATLTADMLDHFQTAVLLMCAAFMTHMCLWMQRHGRHLRQELETSLAGAVARVNAPAVIGLVALAIAREGFEVVVYLYGMGVASGIASVATGALIGGILAVVSGWALVHGIRFLNPRIFFKVTGVFLLITASSLVVNATGRLMQAGFFPGLASVAWDSSFLLDERSLVGQAVQALSGYQSTPALLTVLVYALYWACFFAAKRLMAPKSGARAAVLAVALLGVFHGGKASAQTAPAPTPAERLKMKYSGFGEMQFAYYDYGPGPTDKLANGAPKDSRATFDATRFEVEIEGYYVPYGVEFEAEVEFEHGGTGSAKELDRKESHQFDTDVEKGGEVYLEEFYLKKHFSADVSAAAGRIMVGVGLLSLYNRSTDYLAVQRDEAERHLLPETWNEMGFQIEATFGDFRLLGQVVNGLDSSGFSSEYWVASGHQQAFENAVATDMAGVARIDYTGLGGTVLGMSGYYGGTSRDRPEPDLVRSPCDKSSADKVAPCGYVNAPVLIADVHGTFNLESLRGSGDVIWGRLQNAGLITKSNQSVPETLDVAQSPVADQAFGYWAEVGYDVGPLVHSRADSRVEPFVRYDYYNTMYKVSGVTTKDPRYERRVVTLGAAYTLGNALYAKFDVSQRRFGAGNLRKEDTAELGLGFIL